MENKATILQRRENAEQGIEVINSDISPQSFLYKFSRVDSSFIDENCTVGDFSRVMNSNFEKFVRIDRQNLIYYSQLGLCTYTGMFDVIMHTKIGRFCSISWGVTIGPGEHDYRNITSHDFLYNSYYGLIPKDAPLPYNRFESVCEIGNDVWVGANSTILRGVTVGHGAIIGANSIVTKDVPPYAIVAGNPAKVMKYRFTKDVIEDLMELEWWNLPLDLIRENYDAFKAKDIKIAINKLKKTL